MSTVLGSLTLMGRACKALRPCRFMDMESFALEAEAKGAVVMLALHGGAQGNGQVQSFLAEMEVPFTGPNWQSASLCGNQVCLPTSMHNA